MFNRGARRRSRDDRTREDRDQVPVFYPCHVSGVEEVYALLPAVLPGRTPPAWCHACLNPASGLSLVFDDFFSTGSNATIPLVLARLMPRRSYLGAAEGLLVLVAGLFAFVTLIISYKVSSCGMCATGRLEPWVDIAAGVAFVTSGLFLRVRRPDNSLWILLVIAGFGRLFEAILVQFPITFFVPWQGIKNALLIAVPWHIALLFPTGQPLRRFRFVLPSVYTWAVTATVVRGVAADREFLVRFNDATVVRPGLGNPEAWQFALDALTWWWGLNIAVGMLALATRWATGNRATRRAFATLFVSVPFVLLQVLPTYLTAIPMEVAVWAAQLTTFALPITVVLGIVGPRIWEGRISQLIRELDSAITAGDVEQAVRSTLEDPRVKVGLRLPDGGSFADIAGEPLVVALDDPGRATPVRHKGEIIGALLHSPTSDLSLMVAVASTASLALRRIQLQATVQAQLVEVTKSRQRIAAAADDARRMIERNLHDGAQQSLVALAMTLDLEKAKFTDSRVHEVLDNAVSQVRAALEEIRGLSRGMYPPALYSDGLATALQGVADSSPVPVRMQIHPGRFAPHVEATIYFIVAEALTNTAKHARAKGVSVEVSLSQDDLRTEVIDDGIGGAVVRHGSGLQGLCDRVEAMGGTLSVHSPPEGGTTILASVPT